MLNNPAVKRMAQYEEIFWENPKKMQSGEFA
jgi:hypothetical protein